MRVGTRKREIRWKRVRTESNSQDHDNVLIHYVCGESMSGEAVSRRLVFIYRSPPRNHCPRFPIGASNKIGQDLLSHPIGIGELDPKQASAYGSPAVSHLYKGRYFASKVHHHFHDTQQKSLRGLEKVDGPFERI